MTSQTAPPPGGIQIVQQIMTPSGEIQQIPIQLSPQQLQVNTLTHFDDVIGSIFAMLLIAWYVISVRGMP